MNKITNYEEFNNYLETLCETKIIDYSFDLIEKSLVIKVENVYDDVEDFESVITFKNVGAIYYRDAAIQELFYDNDYDEDYWLEFSEFYIYNQKQRKEIKFNFDGNSKESDISWYYNVAIDVWGVKSIFLYVQEIEIDGTSYSLLD